MLHLKGRSKSLRPLCLKRCLTEGLPPVTGIQWLPRRVCVRYGGPREPPSSVTADTNLLIFCPFPGFRFPQLPLVPKAILCPTVYLLVGSLLSHRFRDQAQVTKCLFPMNRLPALVFPFSFNLSYFYLEAVSPSKPGWP